MFKLNRRETGQEAGRWGFGQGKLKWRGQKQRDFWFDSQINCECIQFTSSCSLTYLKQHILAQKYNEHKLTGMSQNRSRDKAKKRYNEEEEETLSHDPITPPNFFFSSLSNHLPFLMLLTTRRYFFRRKWERREERSRDIDLRLFFHIFYLPKDSLGFLIWEEAEEVASLCLSQCRSLFSPNFKARVSSLIYGLYSDSRVTTNGS